VALNRYSRTAALLGALTACALSAEAVPFSFGSHYYEFIAASGTTWTSADTAALGLSYLGLPGHLATLTSAAEDTAIAVNWTGGEYYVGGYQAPPTETNAAAGWTWVHGEGPFGYTNWLSGEPNDYYGAGSEQYLAIGLSPIYGWNDEGNLGNVAGYVVEYEAVPEPGTLSLVGLGLASVLRSRRKKA
jgi:hypothetical protein